MNFKKISLKKVLAILFIIAVLLGFVIVYFSLSGQNQLPSAKTTCTFAVQPPANKLVRMSLVNQEVWAWAIGTDTERKRNIFRLNFDGTQAAPPIDTPDFIDPSVMLNTEKEIWFDSVMENKTVILRYNYDGSPAGDPISLPEDKLFVTMALVDSEVWILDNVNTVYHYDFEGNLLYDSPSVSTIEDTKTLAQIGKDIWVLGSSNATPVIKRYNAEVGQIGSEITGNGLTLGFFNEIKRVGNQVWVTSDNPNGVISRFNLNGTPAGKPIRMQAYGLVPFANQAWLSNGKDNLITVSDLEGKLLNNCSATN